ncbi:Solute carrier family 7 member 13 [Dryobates pubescens]|uniref:Solute carrier family 7 member 13 n=1 Tax=Dryobates pubescens TaxID=118200 RepID=A0A093G7W9_DRYPU|nr:solute carrier family 7 member 13 [Dryobates pubescens]KFV62927.1 Solute carrier family 7 member 13 [Dryobates pubescens]
MGKDKSNDLKVVRSKEKAKIRLKRNIGYFDGVSFIVGSIVGAGIFVSPTGVLKHSLLNVGVALTIWTASGLVSLMGALCYAELGTTLPFSGGEYSHIKRGLGSLPAFMFIWTSTFTKPASNAARALLFAEYATQPFYGICPAPEVLKKCLALVVLWSLGILNGRSVKMAAWVQTVFTLLKMMALSVIAVGGIVLLAGGKKENLMRFEDPFGSEIPSASQVAEAFFQGLYAYGGWWSLNYMAEEMKNPSRNIPLTVMTAVPSVIVFYLLVNISYLTVLTPKEIVSSVAVAVTWADRVIPSVAWIIPLSVAVSIFGALNSSMFTLGRLSYAGSQSGHLPVLISMLNVHTCTPAPAIIFSTTIASIFIIPSDLITLTNYFGFSAWLMIGLTCASLIVLRYREPHLHRPYKVFLPVPFVMVAMSFFLVLAPIVWSPNLQYVYAFLFMLGSLIVYLPFIHFKLHFAFLDKITCHLQLLLEVCPADGCDEGKHE